MKFLNQPITLSGWKLLAGLLLMWSTGVTMGHTSPDQQSPFLRPLAHYLNAIANWGAIVSGFLLVWASRRKPAL